MVTISSNVPLNSDISLRVRDPVTAVELEMAVELETAVDPVMTFLAVTTKMTSMVAATTISQLRIVMP